MIPVLGPLLVLLLGPTIVCSYAVPASPKAGVGVVTLRLEPSEALVHPGDAVTFECRTTSSNATLSWETPAGLRHFEVSRGVSVEAGEATRFSRITVRAATRAMSGEVVCAVEGGGDKAHAVLVVSGVRMGGACRRSSDCATERAMCVEGACDCPRGHVRLRVKGRAHDVCREIIYSLYDPCEYDEQCAHLVDPKSLCKSVCVCAPWARDRRGKCVSINELSYNRSQEMYRVGLIAVTCIIILIVAVSLWITLKRSCEEHSRDSQRRSISQSDSNYPRSLSIDVSSDKPPSYDDVLVNAEAQDTVASPPNFKDALKHCMTAKKLLRQVSAPAGELLPQSFNLSPKK